ncbi:MAG: family 20 glycosylhydrolase, partial [Bacteroidota bacterium]
MMSACFSLLLMLHAYGQNTYSILPQPAKLTPAEGHFNFKNNTSIVVTKGAASFVAVANMLSDQINGSFGLKLPIKNGNTKSNAINFIFNNQLAEEAYQLKVSNNKIDIEAKTGKGAFYALQSLFQLMPAQIFSTTPSSLAATASACSIEDAPRFNYRGLMLDAGRNFFPVAFIKRYIDLMAVYKLNTFHWHLTEDQGWRIEIKKYPKLTQVGAYRKGSMVGKYSDSKFDTLNYGGYYSQLEVKEIVAYAQARQITVVPEIEMPGHSQAAISAYPWLSCSGKAQDVAKSWGVFEDVFCSKDSTFHFLTDVLDEVMALFPGKYIHIGGDECPKTRWKTCTKCQALIQREHLKDEHALQSYFITRIEKYVNSKGKQIIGWDEILEGGLAPNAAVMSWRGEEGGIAAAKQNHKVVMSPGSHCYFDHYQASPGDEPLAIGGFTPLEKVYGYNPIPKSLNAQEAQYIMGAQANVWTEYILDEKQVEYMSMPRMAALSEVLWTNVENKNEGNFLLRLQKHFLLLDRMQVNYAKGIYQVNYKVRNDVNGNAVYLELLANPYLGEIRFTRDGTDPRMESEKYTAPIVLTGTIQIKAALFQEGKIKSRILIRSFDINKASNQSLSFTKEPSKYYNAGHFV